MWAMKKLKMDWNEAVEQRLNGLNELHKFHLKVYESSSLNKENMMYHEQNIKKRHFFVEDLVFFLILGCSCFRANSSPNGLVLI